MIGLGEQLFTQNCSACHNFKSRGNGPELSGVIREVSPAWLKHFIRNLPKLIEEDDPRAVQLYEEYKNYMPAFPNLDETQLEALLAFLHTYEKVEPLQGEQMSHTLSLEDPVPEKIEKSGIILTLEEVTQIPKSADTPPLARINKLITLGKENPRIFLHDLRGKLYELKNQEPKVLSHHSLIRVTLQKFGARLYIFSFPFSYFSYISQKLPFTHQQPHLGVKSKR
ncbi:hypothetical protein BH23BAC1_BH23BAC1_50620 [soil metagenome]